VKIFIFVNDLPQKVRIILFVDHETGLATNLRIALFEQNVYKVYLSNIIEGSRVLLGISCFRNPPK